MIYDLIDRLTDKFYDFDETDSERSILAGGWLIVFGCFAIVLDSELLLLAGALALVGVGFIASGLYYLTTPSKLHKQGRSDINAKE